MAAPSELIDARIEDLGEYPAVVTLTPSGDKTVPQIDPGVAQLSGTATRKIKK